VGPSKQARVKPDCLHERHQFSCQEGGSLKCAGGAHNARATRLSGDAWCVAMLALPALWGSFAFRSLLALTTAATGGLWTSAHLRTQGGPSCGLSACIVPPQNGLVREFGYALAAAVACQDIGVAPSHRSGLALPLPVPPRPVECARWLGIRDCVWPCVHAACASATSDSHLCTLHAPLVLLGHSPTWSTTFLASDGLPVRCESALRVLLS